MNDLSHLPRGWIRTTLGEVCQWSSGGTPRRTNPLYFGGEIPWAIIGDLNDSVVMETQSHITQEGLDNSSAKWVEEGSVMVAMYGSIGKLGIAGRPLTTNQAIAFAKSDKVLPKFLFYFLLSERSNLQNVGIGVTQKNISQTIIKGYAFAYPPLAEQKRIVAKIEELFTKLDAGVAELQQAKAQLARYRQSVLKAAVTGELTREWREAHQDELEPASELLVRILAERRRKWEEEELAKMSAKGNEPKDDKWKGKYQEPSEANTLSLNHIPESWTWASVEQISDPVKTVTYGILKPGPYITGGIPMLRILDIKGGTVDLKNAHKISHELSERYQRTILEGDECLISLVGSIGISAHVPDSISGVNVHRNLGVIRTLNEIESRYLAITLSSPFLQEQIRGFTTGANQPLFNLGELKKLVLPIPNRFEQQRILAKLYRRFSVLDEIEQELDQGLLRAERLQQSILKRAFEGRLLH